MLVGRSTLCGPPIVGGGLRFGLPLSRHIAGRHVTRVRQRTPRCDGQEDGNDTNLSNNDSFKEPASTGGQPSTRWSRRLNRQQSVLEAVGTTLRDTAASVVSFRKSIAAIEQRSTAAAQHRQGANGAELANAWERLKYAYYNWRSDNLSDLQLFLTLNVALVLGAALVKRLFLDNTGLTCGTEGVDCRVDWWLDLYQVGVWVFADGFPEPQEASGAILAFALVVATLGIAAFALSLALVEQVVLEILQTNVQQGSSIYEAGHYVVLAWGESQADLELIERVLTQLAVAHKHAGGCTVVVMTGRDKLEMESMYSKSVPEDKRAGSTFVFRKGSALHTRDLQRANVSYAAATIIVSDSKRDAIDADSQVVRAAILIDELDRPQAGQPDPRKGVVVCEVMDPSTVGLLAYSCSSRVMGLPSHLINARRIAATVRHPVGVTISRFLLDYRSHAQLCMEHFPQLEGKPFHELPYYFPDGLVLGLVNNYTTQAAVPPTRDAVVQAGDYLLIARPATQYEKYGYLPVEQPVQADVGDWAASDYRTFMSSTQDLTVSISPSNPSHTNGCAIQPLGVLATGLPNGGGLPNGNDASPLLGAPMLSTTRSMGRGGGRGVDGTVAASMSSYNEMEDEELYLLPREYYSSMDEEQQVLICGWGSPTFMRVLLHELDSGPSALKRGSGITLFNQHATEEIMGYINSLRLQHITLQHVRGNPLKDMDMSAKLRITDYSCAVVLCDLLWREDSFESGGRYENERQTRRLDASIMAVQLNIRKQLELQQHSDINIVCEKFTVEGVVTRFEDPHRLPAGSCLNSNSFSAKMIVQTMLQPKMLLPALNVGTGCNLMVQDSSAFARPGEHLTYWQLMARVSSVNQVLAGYYDVPFTIDTPVGVVINLAPSERSVPRVWNRNDGRVKVVTFQSLPGKPAADRAIAMSELVAPAVERRTAAARQGQGQGQDVGSEVTAAAWGGRSQLPDLL